MTAHWDALAALFAAHPLAQLIGLIAFLMGILTFIQHDDQRLRIFLTLFSALIGLHFFC